MDRIINDYEEVAIAVSRGFGAGWSTWSDVSPLDPDFNQLFIKKEYEKARRLADKRQIYSGGIEDIEIIWVPIDTKFIIQEYDGSETIMMQTDFDWITA